VFDAAKNKNYLMTALTVAGCIYMVIEGKKAVKRHSLTRLNLERKTCQREEGSYENPELMFQQQSTT
uniref:Protein FAM162A n=1 Tax=Mus spicilegus TaxID=10103 RepID=A0A8C6G657_MUSSI